MAKPYTVQHRWLLERGISSAEFARRAGVHVTLARRHLGGRGPVSARILREYERAYPGGPWKAGTWARRERALPVRRAERLRHFKEMVAERVMAGPPLVVRNGKIIRADGISG